MATPDHARDPFELIGITIEGKYRVASVIGDGGFGVVYRGVHTGFGELIAIKCLKIPRDLDDKARGELLDQLKEEGRLLHKLSKATPGIVQALDVGAMTTAAGVWVPYLVLEWLEGETLAEFQKRREEDHLGGMPLAEAVELLTPAARALAVAHQNKIAHRDVKPANLFVTKVGERRTVKVLDFGIAKVLTDTTITEALAHTRAGPSAFTPRYGAPEQFNKQRGATGPWTDVFALALIVVELTTGRRALDGDDPTQLYVASADPTLRPTFRGRGLDVADPVETVIGKALHVEPKYRYGDAGDFWDALTAAVGVSPEAPRTSQPAVSSGKAKTVVVPSSDDNLATAEFAANAALPVHTEPAPSLPEPHAQTQPAENAKPSPVIVSARDHSKPPPSVTSASAQVAAAAEDPGPPRRGRAPDDPMAETPLIARVPRALAPGEVATQPSAGVRGPGGSTTGGASKDAPPSAPASSVPPPASGRGLLIALGVIGVAAVATAYLYFTGPGASLPAGPKGSASAVGTSRPTGPRPSGTGTSSAASSATASSSVSGLAEAGAPPPPPPEDMVYIAPMSAKLGEGPTARDVVLTKGFFLEKREVTAGSYHTCVTSGVCPPANEVKSELRFKSPSPADPDGGAADAGVPPEAKEQEDVWIARCTERAGQNDHPVNCLTYSAAEQYCRWKKRRLPTEAEWEAAAQGADQRAYPWGNSRPDCDRACYDKNSECRGGDVATCAAGSPAGDRTPTEISGMAGNVAEWVSDGWLPKPLSGTDPRANPFAKTRVVRGGDFFSNVDMLRASTRREMHPGAAEVWIGVRCAMDATPSL
ncbi:MAG: SUMF1/EgtB/PvdO family nonheme iron enzyme [Polyangiaceae bacterium]